MIINTFPNCCMFSPANFDAKVYPESFPQRIFDLVDDNDDDDDDEKEEEFCLILLQG